MLRTTIDELSISFIADENFHINQLKNWNVMCHNFMLRLMKGLKISCKPEISKVNLAGYDITYNLGSNDPIKFGYHSLNIKSGMTMKFHAVALGRFLQSSDMSILDILKLINLISKENRFLMRIRRIDILADYIDENILEVDQIYKGLRAGQIEVLDSNGNVNRSSINSFENNFKANTIYVGQKKTSERFLRIYDKKKEQLMLGGVHYQKAKTVEQWIRFEVSYKKSLATQIGCMLLEIESDEELVSFIAGQILSKYQLYENGKKMDISTKLANFMSNQVSAPVLDYNKDGSIEKLKDYFKIGNSGFQGLLYQIRILEGEKAMEDYLESLVEFQLSKYKPSQNILDRVEKMQEVKRNKE